MTTTVEESQSFEFKRGDVCWFEYHCYESLESADAELWLRSHRRIRVLTVSERGAGENQQERAECGTPACYLVAFDDNFTATVFEDELMRSRSGFYCDDPPPR